MKNQTQFSVYSFWSIDDNAANASKENIASHKKHISEFDLPIKSKRAQNHTRTSNYGINSNTMSQAPKSLSPKMELRLKLLPKIGAFRSRNWISREEEEYFMRVLSESAYGNKFEKDQAVLKVKRELDRITRNNNNGLSDIPLNKMNNGKHSKFEDKKSITPPGVSRIHEVHGSIENQNKQTNNPHHHDIIELDSIHAASLGKKMIETLFVEMCFFARMGFAQPPCCLACAYSIGKIKDGKDKGMKEEQEGKQKGQLLQCKRLVVWRKDGKSILRPDNLRENIVLVTCQAAKKLMDKESVNGWKWDCSKRVMIFNA